MSLKDDIMALADVYYAQCTQSEEGSSLRDPDSARATLERRAAVADALLEACHRALESMSVINLYPQYRSGASMDSERTLRAAIAMATAKDAT